ncbi:MAG: hypothetical protein IPJ58_19170 [Ardenticatenia bacterium]|nr:hypothetical protein [Ardenticatenia bacterium]
MHQLKITLRHITPPIRRRFTVPSNVLLAQLHPIVQFIMGLSARATDGLLDRPERRNRPETLAVQKLSQPQQSPPTESRHG